MIASRENPNDVIFAQITQPTKLTALTYLLIDLSLALLSVYLYLLIFFISLPYIVTS